MLTKKQRQKLELRGYCHVMLETIPLNEFTKITNNKVIIDRFMKYKFSFKLKLVG
jgi:hypothetical protein